MASRPVMQQQNRVEGGAQGGAVKQKSMAGIGGRNRRALGDIGNVVTGRAVAEGKPLPNVTRPVTRSFCAQLLANAQEAAAAENKKKCVAVNVAGAVKIKKPALKKNAVKPKPEVVVEISSDSDTEKAGKKAREESSSKKKAPTLTSTLTARSKAACGLSKRPPKEDNVVDIDAADASNELAVTDYVDDLYKFYKIAENECRFGDYMHSQPDINEKMRAILIDWLTEVHYKFELSQETLYLTINIIDRYLALKTTPRKELQLLGMGAMLVASKYEEIWAPEVNDFVSMSDRAYTHAQVLVMEKRILGELQWNLTVPTPYVFLVRFIKASIPDSDMENMVYFLAELGMMNYASSLYCPSMFAASAVYAARCTLKKAPLWDNTLKLHAGFTEAQLLDCAKLLVSYHGVYAADHRLKVIFKKYSTTERGAVALLPPAKSLFAASA